MKALRLTQEMKAALERLYKTNGQSDFVAYSTAIALAERGLISIPSEYLAQRTASAQFPEYRVTLTQEGQRWCELHFL